MLIGLPLAHNPVLHDLAPGSALLHRLNASGDAAVDRRVSIVVMPKQQWLGLRAYCDFKGGDGELCARKAAKLVRSLAVGGLFSAIVGTVLGPFGGPFVALGVTALKGAAIIWTADRLFRMVLSPPVYMMSPASDGLIPVSSQRWRNRQFEYLLDGRSEPGTPAHNAETRNNAVRARIQDALVRRMGLRRGVSP